MTLDNIEQKNLLLQIFNAATIPAQHIEILYALKKSIETAEIKIKINELDIHFQK